MSPPLRLQQQADNSGDSQAQSPGDGASGGFIHQQQIGRKLAGKLDGSDSPSSRDSGRSGDGPGFRLECRMA